jgi:hypothetical protein
VSTLIDVTVTVGPVVVVLLVLVVLIRKQR